MIVFNCYMKIFKTKYEAGHYIPGYFLFRGSCHADGRWKKVKTAFMQIPALILEW